MIVLSVKLLLALIIGRRDDSMREAKEKNRNFNTGKSYPYLVFIVVYIIFAMLQSDKFLTMANMKTIVQQSSVMAIVAVGMLFVIVQGEIDLSVSSVMGLAGFICADLAQINVPAAIVAGILTGTAVGLTNGLVYTYLKIPSMIVTVGMHMILVGFMRIYSGSKSVTFGMGMKMFGKFPRLIFILAAVVAVSHILLKYRPFGRYCIAIGGDRKLCRQNGIPVQRINTLAFVVSGTFAAIAGIIKGCRIGFAVPTAEIGYSFECITAVALSGAPITGGVGSVFNTIIGTMTISMLSNGLVITGVTPELRDVCTGMILIWSVYISLRHRNENLMQ